MSESKRTGEVRLEFYSNELDIEGQEPGSAVNPAAMPEMREALLEYRAAAQAQYARWGGDPEMTVLDDRDIEEFKALGYVETNEAPTRLAPEVRPQFSP